MKSSERRKVNVLEIKCLISLVGVSRMDIVGNEEVRRRAGIEREIASRANQRLLRWFGHVERMDEYRLVRKVLRPKSVEEWIRGRPRLGWMDGGCWAVLWARYCSSCIPQLSNRLADKSTTPPTSGCSGELKPNTADLRVDHHLRREWAFIRASLFLSLNRH